MAATKQKSKFVAIVGPTASGKSALAMKIAQEFDGEIICADSRTVYKGMDIGTAKPTKEDQAAIPHHLLDIVEPNEFFTAADFQKRAKKVIEEVEKRKHLPLLVGGSGLYVDSVLFDFKFSPKSDAQLRAKLNNMELVDLIAYANTHDIFLGGIERTNKRHIVRAIERGGMVEQRLKLRKKTLVVGINPSPDVLRERIKSRIDQIIENGFIDEAKKLATKYGWEHEANSIYKVVQEYEQGTKTVDDIKDELIKKHSSLAKRQKTWFKRNKFIHWFEDPRQAYDFLANALNT